MNVKCLSKALNEHMQRFIAISIKLYEELSGELCTHGTKYLVCASPLIDFKLIVVKLL